MNKSDLKTGYVVQTKNGLYWHVMLNTFNDNKLICFSEDAGYNFSFMPLDKYEDDLRYASNKNYDIVKIMRGQYLGDSFKKLASREYDKLEVLRKRKTPIDEFVELKNALSDIVEKANMLIKKLDKSNK
jgi:uncharacterized protein YkvS